MRPNTPAEHAPAPRAAPAEARRRTISATVEAPLPGASPGSPPPAQRDLHQVARIWNFIRGRPAYRRDQARLRALLGGHTNWAASTGPHPPPTVFPSGVVERVLTIRHPGTHSTRRRAARREVESIARRWGEIIGPELPDPTLDAKTLPTVTAAYLRASCFSLVIPFREGWAPGEDPALANEIVIRIRPWAAAGEVINAYRRAHREVLSVSSRFAEEWTAAEKETRNVGGSAKGERRSRDPERDDRIRKVHDLYAHKDPRGIHSYAWIARKLGIARSTACTYNALGTVRCPFCPPAK